MQTRQIAVGIVAAGLLTTFGWWAGSRRVGSPVSLGPTPAFAGEIEPAEEGATYLSTDGGNAYLWRVNGGRIELVGQCIRSMGGPDDQATFVWLPGVERRS